MLAYLAMTEWCLKLEKWLKPWHIGAHLIVLWWLPTWQGLYGFQKSLRLCALGESSLSIGRLNLFWEISLYCWIRIKTCTGQAFWVTMISLEGQLSRPQHVMVALHHWLHVLLGVECQLCPLPLRVTDITPQLIAACFGALLQLAEGYWPWRLSVLGLHNKPVLLRISKESSDRIRREALLICHSKISKIVCSAPLRKRSNSAGHYIWSSGRR